MGKRKLQSHSGISIIELMIGITIAIFVMATVYQTIRLQWQTVSRNAARTELTTDAKRLLSSIGKHLRSSGYNPTGTIYDQDKSVRSRIGIIKATSQEIVFTRDQNGNGMIDGVDSLSIDHSPLDRSTSGEEISGFRLNGRRLEHFVKEANSGRWILLTDRAKRFTLSYAGRNGQKLTTTSLGTNPIQLSHIDRIDLRLVLEENVGGLSIETDVTSSVSIRNRPFGIEENS